MPPVTPNEEPTAGDRIRAARTELMMSQRELADRLGITQTAVSKYELGQRSIPPDVRRELAEILQIDEDLLGDTMRQVTTEDRVVYNVERLREWNDRVALDVSMSLNARGVLRVISALLDRINWVAVVQPDDIRSRGGVPPEVIEEVWDEVIGSRYLQRLGEVEYVFRLVLPSNGERGT
jgi:transcriptional regulator with XRE-family HTH domain